MTINDYKSPLRIRNLHKNRRPSAATGEYWAGFKCGATFPVSSADVSANVAISDMSDICLQFCLVYFSLLVNPPIFFLLNAFAIPFWAFYCRCNANNMLLSSIPTDRDVSSTISLFPIWAMGIMGIIGIMGSTASVLFIETHRYANRKWRNMQVCTVQVE